MYLQRCVLGDASHKIAHLIVSPENYGVAWELLKSSYEHKRLLVSQHLDAMLNLRPPQAATPQSLSKIVDEVRKNLSALDSLGGIDREQYIIRIIVRALPSSVREEWEKSRELNVLSTLDELYTFVNKTIVGMHAIDTNSSGKRKAEASPSFPQKRKNGGHEQRAFVTSSASSCDYCSDKHYTYRCPSFNNLTTAQRWDAVKVKEMCPNCLHQHKDRSCTSGTCKKCGRRHHTLLHSDRKSKRNFSNNNANKPSTSANNQQSA